MESSDAGRVCILTVPRDIAPPANAKALIEWDNNNDGTRPSTNDSTSRLLDSHNVTDVDVKAGEAINLFAHEEKMVKAYDKHISDWFYHECYDVFKKKQETSYMVNYMSPKLAAPWGGLWAGTEYTTYGVFTNIGSNSSSIVKKEWSTVAGWVP